MPGRGGFFEVKFIAVADPYSPIIDDEELDVLQAKLKQLLTEIEGMSAAKAVNGVVVENTFQLCNSCFRNYLSFITEKIEQQS